MDADRQFRMESIKAFFPALVNDSADFVIGFRVGRKDSLLRKFFAWGFNRIVCLLFSLRFDDIDCAFKLFRKDAYRSLVIKADDFIIDTEILAKAVKNNLKIAQVGVNHYLRAAGESTISYSAIPVIFKRLFKLYLELR